MKKNFFKYSLIAISLLILVLLTVSVIFKCYQKKTIEQMVEITKASYEIKNFEQYYENYSGVVECIEENREELLKEEYQFLLVDSYNGKITVSMDSKELELTPQQKKDFKAVKKSFDETLAAVSLETIWVEDNRILFCTSNGQYALVYI